MTLTDLSRRYFFLDRRQAGVCLHSNCLLPIGMLWRPSATLIFACCMLHAACGVGVTSAAATANLEEGIKAAVPFPTALPLFLGSWPLSTPIIPSRYSWPRQIAGTIW